MAEPNRQPDPPVGPPLTRDDLRELEDDLLRELASRADVENLGKDIGWRLLAMALALVVGLVLYIVRGG